MLTLKQEKMATIGSCTATSDTVQLAKELHAGLEAGLTINEIKELFLQLCAYCGFPRGIHGIDIFTAVLAARQAKGQHDPEGPAASTLTDTRSKYDRGEVAQMAVTGWPKELLRSGAMGFIPKLDVVLKEFIFADLYDSDVLSFPDREVATVGAQLSMDGIDPQLQAHLNAALNLGWSEEEVQHIISLVEQLLGPTKGSRGRTLLANALAARNTK